MRKNITMGIILIMALMLLLPSVALAADSFSLNNLDLKELNLDKLSLDDLKKVEDNINKIRSFNRVLKFVALLSLAWGIIKKMFKIAKIGVIIYLIVLFINSNPKILIAIESLFA